jgi:hypothetical protein
MVDIDGKELSQGDKILVVGSSLRHAIITAVSNDTVYSRFIMDGKPYVQKTKLSNQQIYKL